MKTLLAWGAPMLLLGVVVTAAVIPPPPAYAPTGVPGTEVVSAERAQEAPAHVPEEAYPEALPLSPLPSQGQPEAIQEDDPRWDCRTMGNLSCGVEIAGTWYIVTFEDGQPKEVRTR